MWTCPGCGEAIQEQFGQCWKCAGAAAEPAPEARVPDLTVKGHRIPWAIAFVIVLVVLLLMEATLSARGRFSRLPTFDTAWMCLLAATAIGVVSRRPFALRTSAFLLGLGVFLKLGILFLSTATAVEPGGSSFRREFIQILVAAAATVVLTVHLRSPRTPA